MKLGICIYTNDPESIWNAFRFANYSIKQFQDEVRVFLLGKEGSKLKRWILITSTSQSRCGRSLRPEVPSKPAGHASSCDSPRDRMCARSPQWPTCTSSSPSATRF